ncbi:MAG TPA: S8 family serine peptidase [Solirubrobacterales bacterium]|nr:S8 family serine peptidase [Solirubrobacterales bacterium]
MTEPRHSRQPFGRSLAGAAALALALFVGSAPPSAAGAGSGVAVLSPRLSQLATPALEGAAPGAQARALSLARSGPGSLLRRGGRVVVEVGFDNGAAVGVGSLRAVGGKVLDVSRRYQTVTVAAKPAQLRQLAQAPGVRSVKEVLTPIVYGTGFACPQGIAVSEGDQQLRAAEARAVSGVNGEGVTVGILSDSFNKGTSAATHARQDVESGDLPGTGDPCGETDSVNVLEDFTPSEPGEESDDEGRAMTQIVHDLAPGSHLAFATAFFENQYPFAANIERLAKPVSQGGAGAKVIADDVAYFDEPFFQDGPVAAAIDKVTAAGASYFTAAGNDNIIEEPEPGLERNIASWEAPAFRDALSCPVGLTAAIGAVDCMDFNPEPGPANIDNTFGLEVKEGGTLSLDLQWAEPWFGVKTDLDIYLLNAAGEPLEEEIEGTKYLVGSGYNNPGIGEPFEFFQWTNTEAAQEVQLAIVRCTGSCNPGASATESRPLKFALMENGARDVTESEYPVSSGGDTVGPTIFGHAGAASAVTVGAVPFFSNSEPEYYSSRGPVTHYFGPVEGTTPAAELGEPEELSKPDVAATDCGATTFFASFGHFFESEPEEWHFCGTSAAAPHAAAVAALMLQRNPALTPAQVRAKLAETSKPVGSFGADAVGSGLIDARAALEPAPWEVIREESIVPLPIEPAPDVETPTPYTPPSTPHPKMRHAGTAARPSTRFLRHPPKLVRTHSRTARVVFRFGSDQLGATFLCRIDKGVFRPCGARTVRRFGLGGHVVRVRAVGSAGLADPTAAVFRFRVKHVS